MHPISAFCRNDRWGAALFPVDQRGPSVTLTCRWRTWRTGATRGSTCVEFVARLHCLVQTEQVVLCGQLPKVWLSVCLLINTASQCLLSSCQSCRLTSRNRFEEIAWSSASKLPGTGVLGMRHDYQTVTNISSRYAERQNMVSVNYLSQNTLKLFKAPEHGSSFCTLPL